jgi:hypothetical protein
VVFHYQGARIFWLRRDDLVNGVVLSISKSIADARHLQQQNYLPNNVAKKKELNSSITGNFSSKTNASWKAMRYSGVQF